jgi:hypothetical protein
MKMNYRLVTLITALFFALPAFSQKVYYLGVDYPIAIPPAYPQYARYTTYDVAVIPLIVAEDTRVKYEALPYEIKVNNLKKSTAGDFHVIAQLYMLSGKLTSKSTANINIRLGVKVYDKTGAAIAEGKVNRDAFYISLGRKLTDDETKDVVLVNTLLIQNSIDTALAAFNNSMMGGNIIKEVFFAALKDVKKMPELKEFQQQMQELYPIIAKKDQAAIKAKLEAYTPYWEKMTAYAGEGEVNEVKRAALQNLILSNLFTNKMDKINDYIALYKPIDKVESLAFGLLKMKHSEDGEKLLKLMNPSAGLQPIATGGAIKEVTLAQLVENERFIVINNSTITLKGSRNPGVYTGKIKIAKLPVGESNGNIISLDIREDEIFIEGKDATGAAKTFSAASRDIELVRADNGDQFTYKVFGSAFGVGGIGTILKSSYSSDKITVFRAVIPEGSDYFIAKANDKEGFVYSILKGKKKLIEYFSDCPGMEEKFKNKTISDNESIEKIAAIYTECK